MISNQTIIKNKIREFIKKYYINQLYKGALIFLFITFLVFIAYAFLEYYAFLNSPVRTFLFYSYFLMFLATFFVYIAFPVYKLLGFGKQLSNKQVADIVGKHFQEIDDKLLNIIQLELLMESGKYKSHDLLLAAIDTKIEQIKIFPFIKAIPFKKTTKFVKWTSIPLFLFLFIFTIKSEIFTESTERIVNYQKVYERPAPYQFTVLNESLSSFQNEDFTLEIKVTGEETPKDLFVIYGKRTYKCNKISNSLFTYTFTNLQKDIDFQIHTEEVTSQIYKLKVLPKPMTISYVMELVFPSYLNKNNEIIENNGTATVPEGTRITWKFYTKNTDKILFISQEKEAEMTKDKKGET